MNRVFAFLCLLPLSGRTLLFAEAPLDQLRALKIEHAAKVDVQRDTTGTRTVVKLLLQPAKGSNINVEVWLPDAAKWNGRFLGLGNGGAAGKINSGSLAASSAAGYAVATTDMGIARHPTPEMPIPTSESPNPSPGCPRPHPGVPTSLPWFPTHPWSLHTFHRLRAPADWAAGRFDLGASL